jgi:hypothetical protein
VSESESACTYLHHSGGGGQMGGKRSFRVESKRFDLSIAGDDNNRI